MPNFADKDPLKSPQKALVYGMSGSGKSLLAGQLAEPTDNHPGFKLIWFDFENGSDVLYQLSPEAQRNITLITVRDYPTDQQAVKVAYEFAKRKPFKVCVNHGIMGCVTCKTDRSGTAEWDHFDYNKVTDPNTIVVFDSSTQIVSSCMTYITRNETFDKLGEIDKDSKKEWGHYNAQKQILESIWSSVQAAPFKMVVIAHELELNKEDGKNANAKTNQPVGGTSNQSKEFQKYFSHTVHVRLRNNKHSTMSSTTGDLGSVGKSRFNIDVKPEKGLKELFLFDPRKGVKTLEENHLIIEGEAVTEESDTTGEVKSKLKDKLASLKKS